MAKELIKLAIDAMRNKVTVPEEFSANDSAEVLRQAFVELNGGSTKLDIKRMRRNPEMFEILEVLIPTIIQEGLKGDEFFMNLVEYRNIALGDDEQFWSEDNSLFLVSDVSEGNMGIRRQRLDVGSYVTIPRTLKAIKFYEELNLLLSGRVDWNKFVDRVSKSMNNKIYTDIYNLLAGITVSTTGMSSNYFQSGSYSEDTLLGLIEHVEAAMGQPATIFGTRTALRKVTTASIAEVAKLDLYNVGYYGKFNGTPMIMARQRHNIGLETFVLDDTKVFIIAGGDKPFKVVDEGVGYIDDGSVLDNADQTKEYVYTQRYGAGTILTGRMGIYDIS
jgi:hypothetical protein